MSLTELSALVNVPSFGFYALKTARKRHLMAVMSPQSTLEADTFKHGFGKRLLKNFTDCPQNVDD